MGKHRLHGLLKQTIGILFIFFFICFLAPGLNCATPVEMQAPKEPELIQAKPGDSKISLDIKGMEITDVLKMLALRSGKNIVAGKNVRGKITIYLKDVEVMDALEIILISNELAYDMKGNIINVMTDRDYEMLYGEKFQDKTKLKAIKLQYGKASEVSKALNQIKSRVGKIIIDDASNTIVIIDAPQVVSQMEELAQGMDMPTQTKVFELSYSKADTLQKKIEPLLTKGLGTIQIDERTNKIIVTDLIDNLKTIENAIVAFDEKPREVLIDSKILQITLNDTYRAGINWDTVFNGIKSQTGMNFDIPLSGTTKGSPVPTTNPNAVIGGGLHVGGLDTKWGFEAMVKFLETYGKANLLSSPRIVALNNEEAKILVGTNQPYATSTTSQSTVSPNLTSYQVTFLDLGVKLYVTPTINKDGFVTMKIKPEVSSKESKDYTYGPNSDSVPVVKTSKAETTVMVKDGNTIVIAGLIENSESEQVQQVPGLGKAPLIGSLFRNRSIGSDTTPVKNELVIFLTPHIISGDVIAPEVEKYSGLEDRLENQLTQEGIKNVSEKKLSKNEIEAPAIPPKEEIKVAEAKETNLKKEKPKEGSQQDVSKDEYYGIIRKTILDKVRDNYPKEPMPGEVSLSFCVARDGTLAGVPKLLKPANPALKESAVRSVQDAAPFMPFPKNFKKKQETFSIVIIYE